MSNLVRLGLCRLLTKRENGKALEAIQVGKIKADWTDSLPALTALVCNKSRRKKQLNQKGVSNA